MLSLTPKLAAARTGLARKLAITASYLRFGIILLAIATVVILALVLGESKPKQPPQSNAVMSACGPYRKDGNVVIDGQKIVVEIAKNSTEFAKGLGGRPCILPNQGMFFAFNKPGRYPFWMKDMKFPIDIIWIGTSHKVVYMEINESPSTYPDSFENQTAAQYVLELKANQSKVLHMVLGTSVSF